MWGVAIVVINAVRVENFSAARLVGLINQEGNCGGGEVVRWAGWAGRMLVIAGCCCLALACNKGGGAQVCYEMGAEKLISGVFL